MYEFTDDAGFHLTLKDPPAWAMLAAAQAVWPDLSEATIRDEAWRLMENSD